jgi:hypothetical protein
MQGHIFHEMKILIIEYGHDLTTKRADIIKNLILRDGGHIMSKESCKH